MFLKVFNHKILPIDNISEVRLQVNRIFVFYRLYVIISTINISINININFLFANNNFWFVNSSLYV